MRGLIAEPIFFILVISVFGIGVGLRKPRLGLCIFSLAVLLLYALSTMTVSSSLLLLAEVPHTELSDQRLKDEKPGAVVVLSAGRNRGAPEYGGDTVDRLTLERLRYAARVARQTGLPVLVSGGGRAPANQIPIAALMKQTLEQDFDVSVRWKEDRSKNTFENALFSAHILKKEGILSTILVTSAFHMRRAQEAFETAGISIIPAATDFTSNGDFGWRHLLPTSSNLNNSAYALHEIIGRLGYQLYVHSVIDAIQQSPLTTYTDLDMGSQISSDAVIGKVE